MKRGVPSLDAVALAGSGGVLGVLAVVEAALLERRWFPGGGRSRRRGRGEKDLAVGDAAVAGDGGGHEGGVGGDAEGVLGELELHGLGLGVAERVVRLGEVERDAPRGMVNRRRRREERRQREVGALRGRQMERCRGRIGNRCGGGNRFGGLDRLRGLNRSTSEAGVAGSVQEGDEFLELGDGNVGEVSVQVRGLVGEDSDQVFHALETLRCSLLDSLLIIDFGERHEVDSHLMEKGFGIGRIGDWETELTVPWEGEEREWIWKGGRNGGEGKCIYIHGR